MNVLQSSNEKYAESFEDWYNWIGKRVCVSGSKPGILKYFGQTEFADGMWCGVELNEPVGKNNGSVKGVQYFACKDNHGIFVSLSKIEKVHGETAWQRNSNVQKKNNRRFTLHATAPDGKVSGVLSDNEACFPQGDKRRKTTIFNFPNDNVSRMSITSHSQKPQLNNSYVISKETEFLKDCDDDILNKTVILTEENVVNCDDLHNVSKDQIYTEKTSSLNTTFDIDHTQTANNNNNEIVLDGTFVRDEKSVDENQETVCSNISSTGTFKPNESDESLCILSLSQMKDFTVCAEQFLNDSNVKLQNLQLAKSCDNRSVQPGSESRPVKHTATPKFFQTGFMFCQENAALEDSVFLHAETGNDNNVHVRKPNRNSQDLILRSHSDEAKDICFQPAHDQSSTPSDEAKLKFGKKMSFTKSFKLEDSFKLEMKRHSSSTPNKPVAVLEPLVHPDELVSKTDLPFQSVDYLGNVDLSLIANEVMPNSIFDATQPIQEGQLKQKRSIGDDWLVSDSDLHPVPADNFPSSVSGENSDIKRLSEDASDAISHSAGTASTSECSSHRENVKLNVTQDLCHTSAAKSCTVSESDTENIIQDIRQVAVDNSLHKDKVIPVNKVYSLVSQLGSSRDVGNSITQRDSDFDCDKICETLNDFPSDISKSVQRNSIGETISDPQLGLSDTEHRQENSILHQTFNCNSSYSVPQNTSYTISVHEVNNHEGRGTDSKMAAVRKESSVSECLAVNDQLHNMSPNECFSPTENAPSDKTSASALNVTQNLNATVCISSNVNSHNLTFDLTAHSEMENVGTNRSNVHANLTRQSVGPVPCKSNVYSKAATLKNTTVTNSSKPCVPSSRDNTVSSKYADSVKQNTNVQSQKQLNRRHTTAPRIMNSQESKMPTKNQVVSKINTNLKATRNTLQRQSLGAPNNAKKLPDSDSSVFKVPETKAIKNVLNYQRIRQDARKENHLDGSQKYPSGKKIITPTPSSENKSFLLKENTQTVNLPMQNSEKDVKNGLPPPSLSRRNSSHSISSQSSSKIAVFTKNSTPKSLETKDFNPKNDQKVDSSTRRQTIGASPNSQKVNTPLRNQKFNVSANNQKLATSNPKEKQSLMFKKPDSPRVASRLPECGPKRINTAKISTPPLKNIRPCQEVKKKWVSKTELVKEIQNLGASCESKTKEMNFAKIQLRKATLGFEALAVLINYVNEKMFISNIRTDFYDVVLGNRVLMLVGSDVDALCACKILQFLFQCDNVMYSMVPVEGKKSLVETYRRHGVQAKYVVLINCGSTIDIVEHLKPREEVVFFVCDTNRPVDVYNVYSDSQIRLLMKPDDDESIPAFDDIFREDENEDEDESLGESAILRRREKRIWEEKRHKVMFDYTQFSYYGLSAALLMFDLAWKMSLDTNELLWWAIVGLTEQYVMGKIEQDKYVLNAATLQNHVARHNHRNDNATGNCVKIAFDKELNLYLYRHWTLMESFIHSRYTSCKFKLWTFKGQKRMYGFLAEMGIPLSQCRQKFTAMDIKFRKNLIASIEDMTEKYKLDEIIYGSFTYQYGFRKFCASDIVFAVNALLEEIDKEKTPSDKFLNALDSLNKTEKELTYKGLDLARHQLVAMFKQVQSFIDMNYIISAGPFLYAIIEDSTPDVRYFSYPACLTMLAHFLLNAHVNSTKSRKAKSLPLVLMAPDDQDAGRHVVIGIPPVSEGSPKNFFGKAFEQAAERSRISLVQDYFDSSVMDPFSQIHLFKEMANTEAALKTTGAQLKCYLTQLELINNSHKENVGTLADKMETTHRKEMKKLKRKHSSTLEKTLVHYKDEITRTRKSFDKQAVERKEHIELVLRELNQGLEKQRQEQKDKYDDEIREINNRHEEVEDRLKSQVKNLRSQVELVERRTKQAEEKFFRDKNSKIQRAIAKTIDLQKETESLKAVLEMKNSEVKDIVDHNAQMKERLQELSKCREEISNLEGQTKDVQRVLHEKTHLQRELSMRTHDLQVSCEKESKDARRLNLENEELKWRLCESMTKRRTSSYFSEPRNPVDGKRSLRSGLRSSSLSVLHSGCNENNYLMTTSMPASTNEGQAKAKCNRMSISLVSTLPSYEESSVPGSTPKRNRSLSVKPSPSKHFRSPSRRSSSFRDYINNNPLRFMKNNFRESMFYVPSPDQDSPGFLQKKNSISWTIDDISDYYEDMDGSYFFMSSGEKNESESSSTNGESSETSVSYKEMERKCEEDTHSDSFSTRPEGRGDKSKRSHQLVKQSSTSVPRSRSLIDKSIVDVYEAQDRSDWCPADFTEEKSFEYFGAGEKVFPPKDPKRPSGLPRSFSCATSGSLNEKYSTLREKIDQFCHSDLALNSSSTSSNSSNSMSPEPVVSERKTLPTELPREMKSDCTAAATNMGRLAGEAMMQDPELPSNGVKRNKYHRNMVSHIHDDIKLANGRSVMDSSFSSEDPKDKAGNSVSFSTASMESSSQCTTMTDSTNIDISWGDDECPSDNAK